MPATAKKRQKDQGGQGTERAARVEPRRHPRQEQHQQGTEAAGQCRREAHGKAGFAKDQLR